MLPVVFAAAGTVGQTVSTVQLAGSVLLRYVQVYSLQITGNGNTEIVIVYGGEISVAE